MKQNKISLNDVRERYLFENIKTGNLEKLKKTICSNININICDKDGKTPLIWSIIQGNLEIVKYLIKMGAEINKPDNEGKTPIFFSIWSGDISIMSYLISCGVFIDYQDIYGRTPLMEVAYLGDLDLIKILIKGGADLSIEDEEGWNGLAWSLREENFLIADILIRENIPLKNGKIGISLVHYFSKEGIIDIVKYLLKYDKKINYLSKDGETALIGAIKNRYFEIAKLLVRYGADINIKDSEGRSALDYIKDSKDDKLLNYFNQFL